MAQAQAAAWFKNNWNLVHIVLFLWAVGTGLFVLIFFTKRMKPAGLVYEERGRSSLFYNDEFEEVGNARVDFLFFEGRFVVRSGSNIPSTQTRRLFVSFDDVVDSGTEEINGLNLFVIRLRSAEGIAKIAFAAADPERIAAFFGGLTA